MYGWAVWVSIYFLAMYKSSLFKCYHTKCIFRLSWTCLQRLTDHPIFDPSLFFWVLSWSHPFLTWHFHGCEPKLFLSPTFYLSYLSLWTSSINRTPVKQISTFSPTPFLSTEGIMTSFVRQINCIHPFSSQSMLPVYFFSSKHRLCRAFSSSFLSS